MMLQHQSISCLIHRHSHIHLHVVLISFCIAFTYLKVVVRSYTFRYAVASFFITWVRSCMVISQVSTVHMVKLMQLHILLCNCVSWSSNNLIHAPTPWSLCHHYLSCGPIWPTMIRSRYYRDIYHVPFQLVSLR